MAAKEDLSRTLIAKFEGPAVAHGRVSVATFAKVMDGLQQALVAVAEEMAGRAHTRGPVPQEIRDSVTLELTAIRKGSFAATCELRSPSPNELPTTNAEDALDRLMNGIKAERRGIESDLPQAAVANIREFLKLEEGITRLTLNGGRSKVRVVVSEGPRQPGLRPARRAVEVTGYIWEVDYKDNTAEVWDESGKPWRVSAGPALMDDIDRSRRRKVRIVGEEEPERPRRLELGAISPAGADSDFWGTKSIETLAAEQGVVPFAYGAGSAEDVWPEDDQADFLAAIAALRAEG